MEAIQENGITSITIINLSDRCNIEKIIDTIKGKSFMDFRCYACAVGGSFDIMAETDYDASIEEIQGMVMSMLAYQLLGY